MQSRLTSVQPWPTSNREPEASLLGGRTSPEGKPVNNHILLAIPHSEFLSLRPFLTYQSLRANAILQETGERIESAYFPNRGVVSIVVPTREGKSVEVGVVGNEGLVGTSALVGFDTSLHRALVQVAGDGFQVRVEALKSVQASTPQLHAISMRHAMTMALQASQTAACNRFHGVEQRLARWLLSMQDRVGNGYLHVTHDSLATILGTDRPSISLAAGILQRKETIEYTRGEVRVVNRAGLEEASCECYAVLQQFNSPWAIK